MNIEQYQRTKTKCFRYVAALSCAAAIVSGSAGCRGTAPSFSQAFSGLSAPARVPPPAKGSFQVPGSYSGGVGSSASPSGTGLGGSSFGNGPKTTQNAFPNNPNNLINSISNAQSQLLTATNKARDSVNRAADGINSSVEQASARGDRLVQGVSQASAVLTEAAYAPIEQPSISGSNSGRIGDSDSSDTASWRTPVRK